MKTQDLIAQLKHLTQRLVDYFFGLSEADRRRLTGYLYVALTLFTVSFFGLFAIAPTLSTISNLNKQYSDNQLVLDALNKKLSALQILDFQYREIQPDLETIYNAVPRTTKIPQLTRQLENIAAESNVLVTRLSVGTIEIYPNQKKDPIYSFKFTINIEGGRDSINTFIANVINFDRVVGIDRIVTGKGQENKFTGSVTGTAYFSPK